MKKPTRLCWSSVLSLAIMPTSSSTSRGSLKCCAQEPRRREANPPGTGSSRRTKMLPGCCRGGEGGGGGVRNMHSQWADQDVAGVLQTEGRVEKYAQPVGSAHWPKPY